MKRTLIFFEDEEHSMVMRAKGKTSWKDFVMNAALNQLNTPALEPTVEVSTVTPKTPTKIMVSKKKDGEKITEEERRIDEELQKYGVLA